MSQKSTFAPEQVENNQDQFAFGSTFVDDHPCPAESVGETMEGFMLDIAEKYDEILRDRVGTHHGIVDAETAEESWETTLEWARELSETRVGDYSSDIERAEKVKEEAF